ncbi:hypothetical protein HOL21_04580 [Candidatus Woesearchaeota archaeon]|jgi:hypothetical protein|nr:hypothetical protein [Candidatus Woesearchaeota archaeon]MBT5397464.1 hypothetical protein [Candidatus Woesearchaeota archaeon]MBT6367963.1 hypothetical protein [Candidatus Woesearchaeota archaeon]MBT7763187.1 hypothetical protein [Candidatus Woesearchaeota archaeon]
MVTKKRAIIIEDTEDDKVIVTRGLERIGLEVFSHHCFICPYGFLLNPDVILSDTNTHLNKPNPDYVGIIREAYGRDIPIIGMSAVDVSRERWASVGIDQFLLKPTDFLRKREETLKRVVYGTINRS